MVFDYILAVKSFIIMIKSGKTILNCLIIIFGLVKILNKTKCNMLKNLIISFNSFLLKSD